MDSDITNLNYICFFRGKKQCNLLINQFVVFFMSIIISITAEAAFQPTESDTFDSPLYEGIDVLINNSTGEPTLFDGFNISNETPNKIVALIHKGMEQLKNEEYKHGLETLEQAWRLDSSIPAAGLAIGTYYLRVKDYDSALKIAKEIQKNNPKVPEGYMLEGVALAGFGAQTQEISNAFERALEVDPGNIQAGFNLTKILLNQGNFDKARIILTKILSINPNHLEATLKLAELEFNSQNFQIAISLLEAAVEKNPTKLRPRLSLAQIFLLGNMSSKALSVLQPAKQMFPDDLKLNEIMAVAYIKSGNPYDAVKILVDSLKESPSSVVLHYNLALAYEKLKQYNEALQEVKIALKNNPNHIHSKFLNAKLLSRLSKNNEAQLILNTLPLPFRNFPKVKELEGAIALAQNEPEKAISLFRNALQERENNYLTIQLADAQFQAGKPNDGYETLRTWLEKYPDDLFTRVTLADSLLANGRYSEAEKHYSILVDLSPDNIEVRNNLAWLFAKKGDYDKALEQAQIAYNKAPENAQVMDTLGEILFKTGKVDKAEMLLRNATEKSPKSFNIKYHLAQVLISNNNHKEAQSILKTLLSKTTAQSNEHLLIEELLRQIPTK